MWQIYLSCFSCYNFIISLSFPESFKLKLSDEKSIYLSCYPLFKTTVLKYCNVLTSVIDFDRGNPLRCWRAMAGMLRDSSKDNQSMHRFSWCNTFTKYEFYISLQEISSFSKNGMIFFLGWGVFFSYNLLTINAKKCWIHGSKLLNCSWSGSCVFPFGFNINHLIHDFYQLIPRWMFHSTQTAEYSGGSTRRSSCPLCWVGGWRWKLVIYR